MPGPNHAGKPPRVPYLFVISVDILQQSYFELYCTVDNDNMFRLIKQINTHYPYRFYRLCISIVPRIGLFLCCKILQNHLSSLSTALQKHILEEIAPQNGFYFHQFLSIPCRKNTLIGAEQQYSFNDKPKDFYLKCFIFLPQEHDTRKNNYFTEIKCKPRTTDAFLSNWVRVETYRTNI